MTQQNPTEELAFNMGCNECMENKDIIQYAGLPLAIENQQLREALKFYADDENYTSRQVYNNNPEAPDVKEVTPIYDYDEKGDLARQALTKPPASDEDVEKVRKFIRIVGSWVERGGGRSMTHPPVNLNPGCYQSLPKPIKQWAEGV